MSRKTVVSSYCVLMIIRQLKSLKFQSKENHFQTDASGFVRLLHLVEKGEKVSKRFKSYYSIEIRELLVKEVGLFFIMGKVLSKCS